MTKPHKRFHQEIIKKYIKGQSSNQIAKQFDTCHKAILRILEANNIARRSRSIACRRISINEKAFDVLTLDSAYWLGFLMADGCVYKNKIRLALAEKDRYHLNLFRNFLSSSHKITYVKPHTIGKYICQPCYAYEVRSLKLTEVLFTYGIVPQKTHTAKVNKLEYNIDFWRGVIDGDGCISLRTQKNTNTPVSRLYLCGGSFNLMQQFCDFIVYYFPDYKGVVKPKKNIFYVSFSGAKSANIINLLYSNCSTSLDRKYKKALEIISHYQMKNKLI